MLWIYEARFGPSGRTHKSSMNLVQEVVSESRSEPEQEEVMDSDTAQLLSVTPSYYRQSPTIIVGSASCPATGQGHNLTGQGHNVRNVGNCSLESYSVQIETQTDNNTYMYIPVHSGLTPDEYVGVGHRLL